LWLYGNGCEVILILCKKRRLTVISGSLRMSEFLYDISGTGFFCLFRNPVFAGDRSRSGSAAANPARAALEALAATVQLMASFWTVAESGPAFHAGFYAVAGRSPDIVFRTVAAAVDISRTGLIRCAVNIGARGYTQTAASV
jgi:hypothetical protein